MRTWNPEHTALRGLPVLALTLITSAPLLYPLAASGQENAQTRQQAQTLNFAIPAGSLTSALNQLARQAGLVLSYDASIAADRITTGLKGTYTVDQAFALLLRNSGYQARKTPEGYVITAVEQAGGALVLPPVKVTADSIQGYPYGPEVGYIAKQSTTATKTDTPIMETPLSISVISRKEMDDRRVSNVGEAVSYTAGVSTGRTGTTALFGGNNIQIRGFGGGGTAGASLNEYLDGLRLPIAGFVSANLDPWLLERVEVLKGPASVLYGQIQPGGIVNLISKRPHYGMSNALRLRTGKFDEFGIAFDLGAELNDNLLARVVGLSLTGDTQ